MSVLDRAIVKAFERRSHSTTTEKHVVTDVKPPALASPAEILRSQPIAAPPAAPLDAPVQPIHDVQTERVPETEPLVVEEVIEPPVAEIPTSQPMLQAPPVPVPVPVPTPSPVVAPIPIPAPIAVAPLEIAVASLEIASAPIHPAAVEPMTVPAAIKQPVIEVPVAPIQEHASVLFEPAEVAVSKPAVAPPIPVVETIRPAVELTPPSPPAAPVAKSHDWKWPEICEQLDEFTGEGFHQLAKHLQYAAEQGHKVLAFVSSDRDAGRTSVLLTLTRILAREGKSKVLLIDADNRHPNIAELTGEVPQYSLHQVLQGSARMQQAAIPRTPGRVTLLPLTATIPDSEWAKSATALRLLLKSARQEFDLVLMDAGVFGTETRLSDCWLRGSADAVITVSRQLTVQRAEHVVLDWKKIGIESLGVIETFA